MCIRDRLVYLSDNEFEDWQLAELCNFCENSNIILWDGMFNDKDLVERKGWGHSSIKQAIDFNAEANCKKILISHHAPHRSDKELDQIADSLPELFTLASDKLEIEV